MRRRNILSWLLVTIMILSAIPFTGAVYAADTNIAPLGVIDVPHSNGGPSTNINSAAAPSTTSATGNTWNTWGSSIGGSASNPFYVTLNMPDVYEMSGMQIMWWIFTDTGVAWPVSCTVEYKDMATGNWISLGAVGIEHNGEVGQTWVYNGVWNTVTFPSRISTNSIRLRVIKSGTSTAPGFGINRWQVFGDLPETPSLWSVSASGKGSLATNTEEVYTSALVSPRLTGATYQWSLSNSNASIVGSSTGSSVRLRGEVKGTTRLTVTASHPTGSPVTYSMDINVTELKTTQYETNTAAGKAPILPKRVVLEGVQFDTPTPSTIYNGYQFGEEFPDSLWPVTWDMGSFTAADYASDKIGTSFIVSGSVAYGGMTYPATAKINVKEPLAAPDFNHSVTSENVRFNDVFWAPKQVVNAGATIDQAITQLKSTSSARRGLVNFQEAAKRLAGQSYTNQSGGFVFQDTDVYKTLEGISYNLAAIEDDSSMDARKIVLQNELNTWISAIEAIQYSDGYINSCFAQRAPLNAGGSGNSSVRWRYMDRHEMYNIGHFLEAAVAYTRYTEGVGRPDYRLYEAGKRAADHIYKMFGPGGKRVEVPGHEEIEIGLMKMANLVEEYEGVGAGQNYRNTTKLLVDRRGNRTGANARQSGYSGGTYSQDATPIVNETAAVGHAVRATYFYTGITDLAATLPAGNSDRTAYLNVMSRIWDRLKERNTYITGGIGSAQPGTDSEGFGADYALSNTQSYCEICAAIAASNWYQRMNLVYEDAKYIDSMERALYNGVLVGVNLSGGLFYYSTTLQNTGNGRSTWFDCACCPPNVIRTIANMSGYLYTVNKDSVFVNMYGGSKGHVNVQGTKVAIDQVTNYPWEGAVNLSVKPEVAKAFTLNIRIPGWIKAQKYQQVSIKVDGVDIDATPNARGYVTITKTWPTAGTTIDINMPLEVRLTEPDNNVYNIGTASHSNRDRVAIERGPIVYCLETPGVPATATTGRNATSVWVPRDMAMTATWNSALLRGVVDITGTARWNSATGTAQAIQLTPYYARNNRSNNPSNLGSSGSSNDTNSLSVWLNATVGTVQIRGDKNNVTPGDTVTLTAVPHVNFSAAANQRPNAYDWTIESGSAIIDGTPVYAQAPTSGYEKIGGIVGGVTTNTVTYYASTAKIRVMGGGTVTVKVQARNGSTNLYTDTYVIEAGEAALDFTPLIEKIAAAKAITLGSYTPLSFQALSDAIVAAEAWYNANKEDDQLVQSKVIAQVFALDNAIKALVDKAPLVQKIAAAEALNPTAYTPTSYAVLRTAIVSASAELLDPNLTKATVDAQVEAIDTAIKDLVAFGVTPAKSNIALQPKGTAVAQYTNGYILGAGGGAAAVNDGALASSDGNTSWNTYGYQNAPFPYPTVNIRMEWNNLVAIDSTRVLWWYDSTASNGGVQLPKNCTIQYLAEDGVTWVNVTNMKNSSGAPVTTVPVTGNGTNGANTLWQLVSFDEIKTTKLQLTITQARPTVTTAYGGAGISEWEVFGYDIVAKNISADNRLCIESISIPAQGSSTFDPKFAMTSAVDMNVSLIVAEYTDGLLSGINSVPTVSLKAAEPNLSIQSSIPMAAGKTYKFFIWDGTTYVPLSNMTSIADLS